MNTLHDVKVCSIPSICEINGSIAFTESDRDTPFEIKRVFWVYGVREGDIRGLHAHKNSKQILICLNGSIAVTCDDGTRRTESILDSPRIGLYIPPMIWSEQIYSKDSVLLVLSDSYYDESDYIREYQQFREAQQ